MPATIKIEIKGAREVMARLRAGDAALLTEMYRGMTKATSAVEKDAKRYPPESDANAPPPPYYIRGVGTQYANRNRGESERLRENWYSQVRVLTSRIYGGLFGIVTNTLTTYAPWVHGLTRQLQLHESRGWRDVQTIAEDNTKKVAHIFEDVGRRIARIMGGP